jgi:hypothetical protein
MAAISPLRCGAAPTRRHLAAPTLPAAAAPFGTGWRSIANSGRAAASAGRPTSKEFEYERHTLSSLYIGKKQPEIKQLDHLQRRQNRDIREIAEVGCNLQNMLLTVPRRSQ